MHEHKLSEFNPLDLLATAASLQLPRRETTTAPANTSSDSQAEVKSESESTAMRRDTGQRRMTRSATSVTVDNAKPKSKKLESDINIYKVVVKNELSKMLEEHNYGHPKRNFRYILHDEPFSSVENDTDLKLMDSNCNEYRDCLESSSQGEATMDQESNEEVCDIKNFSNLAENDIKCKQTENELVPNEESSSADCGESCINKMCKEECLSVHSPTHDGNCKIVPNCQTLELLEPTSKCSGSLLSEKGLEDSGNCDGQDASLPDVRPVDRLESCEDEQALVDVETVSSDTNKSEDPVCDEHVEETQDSINTLEGFIVSDPCHSCDSGESNNNEQYTEPDTLIMPVQSSASEPNLETSTHIRTDLNNTSASLLSAPLMTDSGVQGNVKKQTIIRSLLTGETIVVVQKSPNGSKEVGKIPFLVDSSQLSTAKLLANGPLVLRERSDISSEKSKASISADSLKHGFLVRDVPSVSEKTETLSDSNKKEQELTNIEIARQQNKINSEKLKLSGKQGTDMDIVSLSDKQVKTSQVPLATVVPLSGIQPSKNTIVGLKPSSVHSALLSKLSNGINQRKGRVAPVVVNNSKLEKFNIGQFASMSSRKIGLVNVKAIPKVAVSGSNKKRVGNVPDCESAAYQQVMKQFPNLAKAYHDDDLLKMAVAPDDILECLPSTNSKTPSEDHVFHDHDYCARGFPPKGSVALLDSIDREPKLGRPPKNGDRRKKAVKRGADSVASSRASSPTNDGQITVSASGDNNKVALETEAKTAQTKRRSSRQKSGRDLSPGDNPDSPEMEGQGDGAKIKITGAFQNDFVYFINKTSRSRRRGSEQPPVPVAPVINAGDIYIPHLSDADIAALKDKPVVVTDNNTGPTNITDEDSNVINTILSMETALERVEPVTDNFGFSSAGTDALHGLDLTPEQMDILFSAIDGAQSDPSVQKFNQENFGLESEASLSPVETIDSVTVPDLPQNAEESLETISDKPLKVPQQNESIPTFSDPEAHLLGNVDNIHEPNMDLILSTASSLKSNLPTLDASEVQDSISAITSVSTPTLPLEASFGSMPSSIDSTVPTPQTNEFSTNEQKPVPLNGMPDISLEKSFDLLGVGDIKNDLFPDMGLSQESTATTTTVTSTSTSSSSEVHSPWIVMVNMYWNDLPAIVLGNQPYVRLVDIYKQILPAKDTGILKKRCQLLGMEVKNCTEMQRYFLVKYGRGYNSKSTLVVSKDDAKRLIGFYVEPQNRVTKPDGSLEKMPSSPLPAPKFRKPSSEASCDSMASGSDSLGASSDASSVTSRKERPKSANPRTPSRRRAATMPVDESVSKRLRHKKINFRNMIQGIKKDGEDTEGEADGSTAVVSDVSPKFEIEQPPENQIDDQLRRRCRSLSQSESSEEQLKTNDPAMIVQTVGKVSSVRPRLHGSRASLKSARPHTVGLLQVRSASLKQFNLLGKQLRRVKGSFPSSGTLQNVLKKRQLNGSVAAVKSDQLKTGTKIANLPGVSVKNLKSDEHVMPETEDCSPQGKVNVTSINLRRTPSRRRTVASSAVNNRVRISGRKRKLKQLYPIENYAYSKKAKTELDSSIHVDSVPVENSRHQRLRPAIPLRTSPRKKRIDLTSGNLSGSHIVVTNPQIASEDEENRPKNVITLTNGPEFETFTALSGDFGD